MWKKKGPLCIFTVISVKYIRLTLMHVIINKYSRRWTISSTISLTSFYSWAKVTLCWIVKKEVTQGIRHKLSWYRINWTTMVEGVWEFVYRVNSFSYSMGTKDYSYIQLYLSKNGFKHLLLLQRCRVKFLAPTWWLTTIYNSSFRGHDSIWLYQELDMYMV